jgi:hypothetical protein
MKKWLKIVLIVSLILNVFFVVVKIIINQSMIYEPTKIKEVNIQEVRTKFFSELKKKYPKLSSKKYFFINVWAPGSWESMHQIPLLDTLVEPLKDDFAYIFANEDENSYAQRKLKEHSSKTKNFIYLNEQKDFLTSIYQEKKTLYFKPWRARIVPMNVIMNSLGKILYFDTLPALSGITYDLENNKTFIKSLNAEQTLTNKKYIRTLDSVFNVLK